MLVGDGPERAALEAHIDALGVRDNVDLAGAVPPEELRRRLQHATVFALPSLWEGMPAAVLEAMACGLPVVASDVNGTRDVVEHGVTGLLHPSGDVPALADCLRSVLVDDTVARALGQAGREAMTARFSFEAVLAAKAELYRAVAAGRAPGRG